MASQQLMSKAYRQQIEAEYQALVNDEEHLHNTLLHKQILEAWKLDSPKMYQRLTMQGIAEKLAYVLQERMFQEMDRLIKAGYPVTDARETAERETLMLEPEADHEEAMKEEQEKILF